jgi:hypothetical protein
MAWPSSIPLEQALVAGDGRQPAHRAEAVLARNVRPLGGPGRLAAGPVRARADVPRAPPAPSLARLCPLDGRRRLGGGGRRAGTGD